MRALAVLASLSLAACAVDDPGAPGGPGGEPGTTALPATTGAFAGTYRVPVPAELAAAALFTVDHYDWTVVGGVATLHYALPIGLVGGTVRVTLSGPLAPGATEVALTGDVGVGTCASDGRFVTCTEQFTDLGTLPISAAVVEDTARREFAGPAAERVAVAQRFGGPDPIGVATFDLLAPAIEDH